MTNELDSLLLQLNTTTGIDFNISSSSLSDDEAVKKLKEIISKIKPIESKEDFLLSIFNGAIKKEDILSGMNKYHIKNSSFFVFYLQSRQPYSNDVISFIKSSMPNPHDMAISIDDKHILVVQTVSETINNELIRSTALSLVEMLEIEAYTSFKIAYDSIESLTDLPTCCSRLIQATDISDIFQLNDKVICFDLLGIERLIYNLPEEEMLSFIKNNLPEGTMSDIDEDTVRTILAFFDNGLSIAETSRQLYVHRNTLIYRLDKFYQSTGLDVRHFKDAVIVMIAFKIRDYLSINK